MADEVYTQWVGRLGSPDYRRRITRADLVFVRLPGETPWTSFRDVYQVDGHAVRDREGRLEKLFRDGAANAVERARALLQENARYNIGSAVRTVNLPMMPLIFLRPRNQNRFSWKRGGGRRIAGVQAIEVELEEVVRPTLVSGDQDYPGDLPAEGSFWIDPDRGTVLRSEIRFHLEGRGHGWIGGATASVTTEYKPEPRLATWVPDVMRERYANLPDSAVFPEPVEATARYSDFRRLRVTTEVEFPQPPP